MNNKACKKMAPNTRREFTLSLMKLIAVSGFAHFQLARRDCLGIVYPPVQPECPGGGNDHDACTSGLDANGNPFETDHCPGGGPAEDVCRPLAYHRDSCPGGKAPEDECSPSGEREFSNGLKDDECETGLPSDDVCNDESSASSDQCPAQNQSTDQCLPTQTTEFDKCYSGESEDDACEDDGGNVSDSCPGGGASRDTCNEDGVGDQCNKEKNPETEDSCPASYVGTPDRCGNSLNPLADDADADDICYNGTNTSLGLGGDDLCGQITIPVIGVNAGYGSDQCNDGSAEQDVCDGSILDSNGKSELDICFGSEEGHGKSEDICHPMDYSATNKGSDDVCYDGMPATDECKPTVGDEDECPGGLPDRDACPSGVSPEDECPGGKLPEDGCNKFDIATDGCTLLNTTSGMDNEPPDECTLHSNDYVE